MSIGVPRKIICEKIKIKCANMHIKNINESPMMELKKPKLQVRKHIIKKCNYAVDGNISKLFIDFFKGKQKGI